MSLKGKNLGLRTVAGAALGVIVVGAALLSPWALAVVAAAVVVVGQDELFRMASSREGVRPMGTLAMCIGVALVAESVLEPSPVVLLTLLLFVPLLFAAELSRGSQRSLENMAITTFGLLYTAVPMALMMMVGFVGREWEPARVLAIIFIVWVNDIFAYLVGCSIGKHKMCPAISPKKSWEGLFGGLLFAVAFAMAAGYMMMGNIYLWGGLGLVVALAGVVGDLLESKIKRECGVKDSGNLIPGHGGMLDRFDALLIAAPVAYIYMLIFGL
jgi:phosphatidate cytidylyltransferase